MRIKQIFVLVFVFIVFLFPSFSFAQTPSATYNHSNIRETEVAIIGQVSGEGFEQFGYAIIFGSSESLLLNIVPISPGLNGDYSVEIKNLLGGTDYYYTMVYGLTAISMGPVKNFKTLNSSLILNHKDVSQNGAKLHGSVSPGHPDFIIKYGKTQALEGGSFSLSIDEYGGFEEYFPDNFPVNTTIYYRAVNPLIPTFYYSPIKSFKTKVESVTFDFRNVSSSAVSVFGSVTNGTPAPKIFLTKDGPVSAQTVELQNDPVLDESNNWKADFDGLEPNTKYFARASKVSDPSYTYLVKSVTTTSSNINLQFFNITDSSMKVSGNLPIGTDAVILCFATSEQVLVSAPDCGSGLLYEAVQNSGVFETTVTNLAPDTTYYFVVRNEADTVDLSAIFDVLTFPTDSNVQLGGEIELPEGPETLVPCDGLDCDFAQLMKLVNNIINFLLKTIALPIFALIFAYVGWLYMSSAESPDQRNKAKSILKNSVIGFIIAMAAFVVIKTILVSLGYEGINYMDF